jgi:hypothetical protein
LLLNELDGIKNNMPLLRVKNRLSGDICVTIWRSFEEVLQGVLCNCIYSQASLAFLAGNSMEELIVKGLNIYDIELCSK